MYLNLGFLCASTSSHAWRWGVNIFNPTFTPLSIYQVAHTARPLCSGLFSRSGVLFLATLKPGFGSAFIPNLNSPGIIERYELSWSWTKDDQSYVSFPAKFSQDNSSFDPSGISFCAIWQFSASSAGYPMTHVVSAKDTMAAVDPISIIWILKILT